MSRFRLRRPSPALVVATLALLAATSGVAFSNPFGPDGTIHACYDAAQFKDGGSTMMIVESPDDCSVPASDYPDHFTFNARGVPGPQGPAGVPGALGPVGPMGPQGQPGPAGQLSTQEITKLTQAKEKLDRIDDRSSDKLDSLLKNLKGKDPVTQKQLDKLLEVLVPLMREMTKIAVQQAIASIKADVGPEKQKELEKQQQKIEKAAEAAEKLKDIEAKKKLAKNQANSVVSHIMQFMRSMQEAQALQLQAIAKG